MNILEIGFGLLIIVGALALTGVCIHVWMEVSKDGRDDENLRVAQR